MNIERQAQEELNNKLCAMWDLRQIDDQACHAHLYDRATGELAFTAYYLLNDPEPIALMDHKHNTITIAE